jgi:hypothetical protein
MEWSRRRRSCFGLLDSGLHEDHAQFGGGFEDEFAVTLGVAGIVEGDELVGDGAAAAGKIGDPGAQGSVEGARGLRALYTVFSIP